MQFFWFRLMMVSATICVLHPAAAQTVDSSAALHAVHGQVMDARNGKPMRGVLIMLQGTRFMDETGRDGRYRIDSVPPGAYDLVSYLSGFRTDARRIEVRDGDLHIDLKKDGLAYQLREVEVEGKRENDFALTRLKAVEGTSIYEGKKTEVVQLDRTTANKATNNARQVMARVSGLNVWESDYGGVQLNIGGRGLSPKRTSNFNTRQNGYDIAADALGYPESYYTPPMEALERIEVVRGAASLQYGTQFGGMINFVLDDHHDSLFSVHSQQTAGAYGLFNSFNSLSGTVRNGQGRKNASYYGFYQHKTSAGWRPNSGFDLNTAHADLHLFPTERLTFDLELTYYDYLAQQPGGLTYEQFREDPEFSNRQRNYFKVNWNIGAIQADYKLSDVTSVNVRTFGLLATRQSLGYRERLPFRDDPGSPDFQENPDPTNARLQRDLIKSFFNNWGTEARYVTRYPLLGNPSALLVGGRYYQGFTEQKQGVGSVFSDADFSFVNEVPLRSDYDFPSRNYALFAENVFSITPKVSVTPGVRVEWIRTEANGLFSNLRDVGRNWLVLGESKANRQRYRNFGLFGIGLSYKHAPRTELYANFSQNYRAINFNDIQIVSETFRVDSNIQDESGYTADAGLRGMFGDWLSYDASVFYINYNDRISVIQETDTTRLQVPIAIRYRTNLEQAHLYGFEGLAQANVSRLMGWEDSLSRLSVFANLALTQGVYDAPGIKAIDGNEVEHVPPINLKWGVDYQIRNLKMALQYTFVDQQFNDATNAGVDDVQSGVVGAIPAYEVVDFSATYQWKWLRLEGGINNLLDANYFTFRAKGYPGPGIIPSPPRTYYVSIGARWARW